MGTIKDQIRVKKLLEIKKIVESDINGNHFTIVRREKNINFMRKYNITFNDIKNIIKTLSTFDIIEGPIEDRSNYEGFILIFAPYYQGTKLYIKIRITKDNKNSICISIHEFGLYDKEEK